MYMYAIKRMGCRLFFQVIARKALQDSSSVTLQHSTSKYTYSPFYPKHIN